jgi:hypothetical protein
MDIKLERAIIRTFKKLREMYDENNQIIPSKIMSVNEINGIFINFCYAEYGVHTGLNGSYISMIGSNMGYKIWFNDQNQCYRTEFSKLIETALSEVESHEFCSMWLRASWEDPKTDNWDHPIVREALKDYKGIQDTHYDQYLRVTDEENVEQVQVGLNINYQHMVNKLKNHNTR